MRLHHTNYSYTNIEWFCNVVFNIFVSKKNKIDAATDLFIVYVSENFVVVTWNARSAQPAAPVHDRHTRRRCDARRLTSVRGCAVMDRTPPCCSRPTAAAAAVYDEYGTSVAAIGGYGPPPAGGPDDGQGCFCCDSDDDSVERARVAHAKRKCYKSCLRNAFVCALLVSYTFAGALMFLGIEGDADDASMGPDPDAGGPVRMAGLMPAQQQNVTAAWLAAAAAGEESRARTVETIWEITVSLNILYRDNWTRLASQELNRFQDDLIHRLTQQMEIESAAVSYRSGGTAAGVDSQAEGPFEWNMATSFLYCLSILTTIGKYARTWHYCDVVMVLIYILLTVNK